MVDKCIHSQRGQGLFQPYRKNLKLMSTVEVMQATVLPQEKLLVMFPKQLLPSNLQAMQEHQKVQALALTSPPILLHRHQHLEGNENKQLSKKIPKRYFFHLFKSFHCSYDYFSQIQRSTHWN